MITAEQKAYFHTFGFIHLPKQFSAEEMKAVTDEADRLWEEHRKGRPLGEDQGVQEFVEKGPVMTQMVADDRIWVRRGAVGTAVRLERVRGQPGL